MSKCDKCGKNAEQMYTVIYKAVFGEMKYVYCENCVQPTLLNLRSRNIEYNIASHIQNQNLKIRCEDDGPIYPDEE